MQGFTLQERDIDDINRKVESFQNYIVRSEPSLGPAENLDASLSALRLFQLALDIQTRDNKLVVDDFNRLNQDTSVRMAYR